MSFSAGTKVLLADGKKTPIANLKRKLSFPAGISPVESTWVACYDWCLT